MKTTAASAPTAKIAATRRVVDTPEVKTAEGAPSPPRVAAPYTVTRIDNPRAPPTCCMALSRPDAAPDEPASTAETPITVSGVKTMPVPTPYSSRGPSSDAA